MINAGGYDSNEAQKVYEVLIRSQTVEFNQNLTAWKHAKENSLHNEDVLDVNKVLAYAKREYSSLCLRDNWVNNTKSKHPKELVRHHS